MAANFNLAFHINLTRANIGAVGSALTGLFNILEAAGNTQVLNLTVAYQTDPTNPDNADIQDVMDYVASRIGANSNVGITTREGS